ncbi:MAG: hypothetical protein R3E95_06645 [Thiolinea sp.]
MALNTGSCSAVTELGAWMNWLQEQGAAKVAIWGHSRGGNRVAWFVAEHDQDLLEKLILVAPATYDVEAAASDYARRYQQPLAPLLEQAQQQVDAGKGDELMDVPALFIARMPGFGGSVLSYSGADGATILTCCRKSINRP